MTKEVPEPKNVDLSLFMLNHPKMATRAYIAAEKAQAETPDWKSERVDMFIDSYDYLLAVGAMTIRKANKALGV